MAITRHNYLVVCASADTARAAREALSNGDVESACGPVIASGITPMGFPYRDDYGYPITRYTFRMLTNLDAIEVTHLAFDPAGQWLEVF